MNTYLSFAKALAIDAGAIMKNGFGLGTTRIWKSDNTPVTDTDQAINNLVLERIKATYPDHSILAEEGSHAVPGSVYTWVCDPIDGTLPFSSGIPIATFSLALVKDGISMLGVIYDPFSDRLFQAVKGEGATLNGSAIAVSSKDTLGGTYIDIESGRLVSMMSELNDRGAKTTRLYCMTCSGVLVACGEFAATLYSGGKAWDIAALKVIVEEAGGMVTDLEGNEQRYDRAELSGGIISNHNLYRELLTLIGSRTN